MREVKKTWQEEGFRGVLRKYKWKVVLPLVGYYLVRDILIYLVLPYLVVKGF